MEAIKNKAIFLDRDGVINRDVPYCSCPEDFELLPGVIEGILLLNKNGFKVVVVTNQSGVSRGYFTENMLAKIHEKMQHEFAIHGAHIDAIYYCPHHPDDNCTCRKPSASMLFKAASHFNIDLNQSYVIGDSAIDIEMGRKAGCKTFLISLSGHKVTSNKAPVDADFIAPDVLTAACLITARNI